MRWPEAPLLDLTARRDAAILFRKVAARGGQPSTLAKVIPTTSR